MDDCGTDRGYQRHRRRGEDCERCRAAHTDHVSRWRVRTGRVKARNSRSLSRMRREAESRG